MDNTNYGLLNNIAGGIREAMTTYQTLKNQQRQESLLENQLKNQEEDRQMKMAQGGLIRGPDGQIQLSPEARANRDLEQGILRRKADVASREGREDDINSEESKRATGFLQQSTGKRFAPMTANEVRQYLSFLSTQNRIDEAKKDKTAKAAKLSDKQIEAFTDLDTATSDLNNLLSSLGNNAGWTGPFDGRIPDMFVGEDQVAFRSALGKYKDAYRKAITGAGAGPTEIAMLEGRLPSEKDTFANFKSKAAEALKEIERRKGVMASNLQKGGKDVSEFVAKSLSGPPTDYPKDDADAVSQARQKRIAELRAKQKSSVAGREK